jgi:gluconokinase
MGNREPLHIVLMGVSGSGKTTVAEQLGTALGWDYAEADVFHPQANKDKMAAGHPLDDEDRWPWLRALRDWISSENEAGHDTITTCSALKRSYRDLLREAAGRVVFVYLEGSKELLSQRLGGRKGHFMPTSLLDSQLDTLEPPTPEEDALTLSIAQSPEELAEAIIHEYGLEDVVRDAATAHDTTV